MYNEDTIIVDVKDKQHLKLLKNYYDNVYSKHTDKKLRRSYNSLIDTLKNDNPDFKFFILLYQYDKETSGMMFYYDNESKTVLIDSLLSNPNCTIDVKFRMLNYAGGYLKINGYDVDFYITPFKKENLKHCPLYSSMNFQLVDVIYKQPVFNQCEDGFDNLVLLCFPVKHYVHQLNKDLFLNMLYNYWMYNFEVPHPDRNSKYNYVALQVYENESVKLKNIFNTIM